MHKPNCPLRLIFSGCDGPTDRLSFYITHFIQPEANNLPSHIKDTKHFLNLIENLPPFPTKALLFTADVTPLYTHIQHDDGISAVINFMEKQKHLLPSNCLPSHIVLHAILDFILKHSTFNFMDAHIHQILRTSMGTRMALPYAKLLMGKEERTIIFSGAKRNALSS